MNNKLVLRKWVGIAALVSALGGCFLDTDPPPGGAAAAAPPAVGDTVSGEAFLGPVIGGTATLSKVKTDGTSEAPAVESVTTTAAGYAFTKTVTGVARVCVSGGSYLDESTGANRNNTVTICSIFNSAKTGTKVYVSPITTFVDEVVKGKLKKTPINSEAELDVTVTDADKYIQGVFNITTAIHSIKPLQAKPTAGNEAKDDYKMGLLLGAYSELVKDYVARCGGDPHAILEGLFKDIQDKVFDGNSLDAAGARIAATFTCNGATTNVPLGAGTADLATAIDNYAKTDSGKAMDADKNTTTSSSIKAAVATGEAAPSQVKSLPSQGLIAIDTANNIGYVPVYSRSAGGDAMIAVVNLAVGATTPVLATVTLAGATTPIASNFNLANGRAYVMASDSSSNLFVYVINSVGYAVESKIPTTGMTYGGNFGGIIVDSGRNRVLVASTNNLGVLDISTTPPVWKQDSIVSTNGTDSITFNSVTGILFNSSDGSMQVIDTLVSPMAKRSFSSPGLSMGTTDGVAFDTLTGMMVIDPEFQDFSFVINMNELAGVTAATAPGVKVDGLGVTNIRGEGPGGQAAVNVLTHQAVIVDEFGENLKLLQMPTIALTGAPNTTQTFAIATTVIPKGLVNGVETQLGVRGDPNSVTVDPARNFAYLLADTQTNYHTFANGFSSNLPLFLVRVDLSLPVKGASPTHPTLKWNPAAAAIRMP